MDFGYDNVLFDEICNMQDEGELYGEDIDFENIEDEFDYM